MFASILSRARTMLMKLNFLMMWCGLVPKGLPALELEEFSWSDLHADLVHSVVEKLQYDDVANMACVCRDWLRVIKRRIPRFYPAGKTPMLVHVKCGEQGQYSYFHYHTPLLDRAFQVRARLNLRKYEIVGAVDGNLLICKQNERGIKIRLFSPLTSEKTQKFQLITSNINFNGCAIHSIELRHSIFLRSLDRCYIVFLIDTSQQNNVTVHMFTQPSGWILGLVYDNANGPFQLSSNPVYLDGRFYCLANKGEKLGVFDMSQRTWNIYALRFINRYPNDICYLVTWVNKVMLVRVSSSQIHLFDLDRKRMVCKEAAELCGRSLYIGPTVAVMSLPTTVMLQNRVFVPHSHQGDPKDVIVAESVKQNEQLYFRARSPLSSEEQLLAATTICCCSNSEDYSGSLSQNRKCIWF